MINISIFYLLIVFFFISSLLFYTGLKYLNLNSKDIFITVFFYSTTLLGLLAGIFLNKITLLLFLFFLIIGSVVFYLTLTNDRLNGFLLTLKNYYILLLSFLIIFTLYEVLFKTNLYLILDYKYYFFILFFISISIYLVLELLLLKSLNKDKLKYILSCVNPIIPISMFILLIGKNSSLLYILLFSRHALSVATVILISTLLEIYFGVFAAIGISKAYDLSVYKYKNKILHMQYNLQMTTLQQIKSNELHIKRICHDLNNHKVVLHNLISGKDYNAALKYLNILGDGISKNDYETLTNHKIINALLLSKKQICISNNITFDSTIKLPDKLQISDFDLCIILGNLIDNAIEGCNNLPSSAIVYININTSIVNENFIFHIKNTFNGMVNFNNNKFSTLKKDKLNHGLGLSTVKSTVDKYQGILELTFNDKEFSSFVRIPLDL